MILILFTLLTSSVHAIVFEHNCKRITINESFEYAISDLEKCSLKRINKISNDAAEEMLSYKAQSTGDYFQIYTKNVDAHYCLQPFNIISKTNVKNKKSIIWNGKEKFKEVISNTSMTTPLLNNLQLTKKNKKTICIAFPGFSKIRKISHLRTNNLFSNNQQEGFLLLSHRMSSVFFFNKELNSIDNIFNFPSSGNIRDVTLTPEGSIYLLTINPLIVNKRPRSCLENWDFHTGVLMNEVCRNDLLGNQAIYSLNNTIIWIYMKNDLIYIDQFDTKAKLLKKYFIRAKQYFNFSEAIIY